MNIRTRKHLTLAAVILAAISVLDTAAAGEAAGENAVQPRSADRAGQRQRAVLGLRLPPAKVLIDGNRVPVLPMLSEAIVGGDAKVQSISAASILAKVHRDRLCLVLHEQHPEYGFDGHKGYPTPEHLAALREHGPCPEHRRSFGPVRAVGGAA